MGFKENLPKVAARDYLKRKADITMKKKAWQAAALVLITLAMLALYYYASTLGF